MESFQIFSVILLALLGLTIIVPNKAQTYSCPNTTTFTPNGTYQANLNILLSTLSSNGNISTGFYNSSAGQNPDVVYGLFLCRGDVNTDVCQQCISLASKDVVQRCPVQKMAVIWYDQCLLRYSNSSISPVQAIDPVYILLTNPLNITGNQQQFSELVENTMSEISAVAAEGTLLQGKKFAVKDLNYTSNSAQRLYTLAQCTPDISRSICIECLQSAAGSLDTKKQGGRALNPSCIAQYEIREFYNQSVIPSPPPPVVNSPPLSPPEKENNNARTIIIIVIPVVVASVTLVISICIILRVRKPMKKVETEDHEITSESMQFDEEIKSGEFLQFDFGIIGVATDDFSEENKLGQGGFGAVYKGKLPNGQVIAVKRLARGSAQGDLEFKNEVLLVAKLQHRNLVRLLGFCLERNEKLLVYEFVPNTSLDHFIFDPVRRANLNWEVRYKIILGIVRGLLYLHEDSRLRIIHRDLKASNILLDAEMNPKISDFGMAKLFLLDQTQDNTSRIVGTYGYMAPEYAMHGQFSVKSDVFSFGVLVLEILSGQKNNCFRNGESIEDLLSCAWKNWKEGTSLNLIDPTLRNGSRNEMMRCIHIGLLCVQEDVGARPTMASVALMLNSYSLTLPMPSQPAFFMHSSFEPSGMSSSNSKADEVIPLSCNEVSVTELYPR